MQIETAKKAVDLVQKIQDIKLMIFDPEWATNITFTVLGNRRIELVTGNKYGLGLLNREESDSIREEIKTILKRKLATLEVELDSL